MKNNRLHIVSLLFGLVIATLLTDSCKPKKQEIPPTVNVHIDVKDDAGKPIDSATVYLYNSQQAFEQAYQNSLNLIYGSTGSVLTTTVVNGVIDFKDLPSNAEYWVLVHQASDPFVGPNGDTIPGYKVDKDNSEAYYKIDAFQNGTEVTANIKLVPVTSLIKFNNVPNGPTNILIGNATNTVDISDGYQKVRKGSLGYQARTGGCVWTGAVDAAGGQVITETLATCDSRMIIFTRNFQPATGEIIYIYVGQNRDKPLAILTSTVSSDTIYLDNQVAASYHAETYLGSDRKCIFQGELPLGTINVPIVQNCK